MAPSRDSLYPLTRGAKEARATRRDHYTGHGLWGVLHKYMPITRWLLEYPWREYSPKDIAGGATLGCILVAQSLAHASLCKVQLINGPYSCILPPVIYALFGTCIHASVGTGGLISLLTGDQLATYGDLAQRTHAGAIFTLLVGCMIALMGILRLAFLVRFLSRPALSGFITASAILIIVSQLKPMLGLPMDEQGGIMHILMSNPSTLKKSNLPTFALSMIAYVFLSNAKMLKKLHWTLKYIGDFKELFLLACSAVFCYKQAEVLKIDIVGHIPAGLPGLSWPLRCQKDWDIAREQLPGAGLVALVTFLSSFAGAKKFAMQGGYQVVALNELLALGFANIGGAFCGAVPTQVGLSRMGIAYQAGVQSQLGANIYVAVVVAVVVQLCGRYMYFVPRCVLNVIIVNGSSHLMEWKQMWWLWDLCRDRERAYFLDFAVWWVSCLCTLYFGAFAGILVAIGVSLLLILYQVADPAIVPLGYVERRNRWLSLADHEDARERSGMVVFRIEGPLFYANIESAQAWLAEEEVANNDRDDPLQVIIFSADCMPFVDTTAVQALRQVIEAYIKRNMVFLIANANGEVGDVFERVLSDLLPRRPYELTHTVQECVHFLQRERGLHVVSQEFSPSATPKPDKVQPLVRMYSVFTPQSHGDTVRARVSAHF